MESSYYGYHLPIDISTHGHQMDHIFYVMHVFMIVLFVGWFSFFAYTLIKFRARAGHKANYAPKYTKFSTYLEVGIALFEAFVLLILAIPAWKVAKASIPTGQDVMQIHVVAQQFAWNIHYPGDDGVFGKTTKELVADDNPVGLDKTDPAAKDDLVVINTLNFPVNKKVVVHLSSKDVIHSFWIPVLRVKQDVVPGLTFPVYFEANQTGNFEIVCSQLCGLGHYRMRGYVGVQTKDEFKQWFAQQKQEQEAYQ